MYKTLLLFIFTCLFCSTSNAQILPWVPVQDMDQLGLRDADLEIKPAQFELYQLNKALFKNHINRVQQEGKAYLYIPMPDGTLANFEVEIISNFKPALAAKYPDIVSFKGYDRSGDRQLFVRGSLSKLGVHAVIHSLEGTIYVDPINHMNDVFHLSYYTKNHKAPTNESTPLACGFGILEDKKNQIRKEKETYLALRSKEGAVAKHIYDIAIAATGEYTAYWGGPEEALSAINSLMDRTNAIFVNELAIELQLVANNDTLLYTDPDTDPFTGRLAGSLISEIIPVLNSRIGFDNYDVGHVLSINCSDAGGIGPGNVCGNNKGSGTTCNNPNLDQFQVGTFTHELGHQFSASHTWNNCREESNSSQLSQANGFEPGSGSTIMSYSTLCGGQNLERIQPEEYYHVNSLESIINYSRTGQGSGCAEIVNTSNTYPELSIPLGDGLVIPANTPFKLRAEGFDAEGDNLTYCWEQYDADFITTPVGFPEDNEPAFRSLPPTTNPIRYFPRLSNLINNQSSREEVLPGYNRGLTFRCTVRDNNPEAGGATWEQIRFRADTSSGPFVVSTLNESRQVLNAGDYIEIHWDVANTNQAPINCQYINIRLSVDAGFSYPIVLAENTPNTGTAMIAIPDTIADFARIMVEAADNIFFDINNFNFEIAPALDTTAILSLAPISIPLHCQPEPLNFEISTQALNGFAVPINLEVLSGLPEGAAVSFSENPVQPGNSSTLNVAFTGIVDQEISLEVQGTAEGIDTFTRTVFFSTLSNDFSDLTIVSPMDGTSGILLSTDFNWRKSAGASEYDFEIATSPAFGASTIEQTSGLTDTTYVPSILLEENILHFWRIRPNNECGPSDFLPPSTFHTASINCTEFKNEERFNLGGNGTFVESPIEITTAGVISDVNIPFIKANYQGVNSLEITLISPTGTEVVLFDRNCGATANLALGFDDDAPNDIICPPDDGIVFKPINPLSIFSGESTQGVWILRVEVVRPGFSNSGALEEWGIEFCATSSVENPTLVNNDTLFAPPALRTAITSDILLATDDQSSAAELVYTLVSLPQNGLLSLDEVPLVIGDQFTQIDIEDFAIKYEHDGSETVADAFTFVIEDGSGGFIPITTQPIVIDANAVSSTRQIIQQSEALELFPNPTKESIYLRNTNWRSEQLNLQVFNMQGQILEQLSLDTNGNLVQLSVASLEPGLYIIRVENNGQISRKRFVKQ